MGRILSAPQLLRAAHLAQFPGGTPCSGTGSSGTEPLRTEVEVEEGAALLAHHDTPVPS